jgi:hypothetical protein
LDWSCFHQNTDPPTKYHCNAIQQWPSIAPVEWRVDGKVVTQGSRVTLTLAPGQVVQAVEIRNHGKQLVPGPARTERPR